MSWLRENWPSFDNNWTLPFGTLTDVVGIVVGLLVLGMTLWIARRQFKIMNKQTEMMEEQNEASKRIEKMTVEQSAISKRQGEIAETQHRLALQQASRAPNIGIYERYRNVNLVEETSTSMLVIHNFGQLPVQWYEWEIWARASDGSSIGLEWPDEQPVPPMSTMFDTLRYMGARLRGTVPLHPNMNVECLSVGGPMEGIVEVRWAVQTDHGRFPANGHHTLTLDRND